MHTQDQFQAPRLEEATNLPSVAELAGELAELKKDFRSMSSFADLFSAGFNVGQTLRIARDAAMIALDESRRQRGLHFPVRFTRPIEDFSRFVNESEKYIRIFQELLDDGQDTESTLGATRLHTEGISLEQLGSDVDTTERPTATRFLYLIMNLYKTALTLNRTLSDVHKFVAPYTDFNPDSSVRFLASAQRLYSRSERILASKIFDKALIESDALSEAIPWGIISFQTMLPGVVGMTVADKVKSTNEERFTFIQERMKKLQEQYAQSEDRELIEAIKKSARTLEEADEMLGTECAALLLTDDKDLIRFREVLSALRYGLNEIRVVSSELKPISQQEEHLNANKFSFFDQCESVLQANQFTLALTLLVKLSDETLRDAQTELDKRKNLLSVMNPVRDEISQSLEALEQSLQISTDALVDLRALISIYESRAMTVFYITSLTEALR